MNISAIILTYNEEIHIRRCIENLLSVAEKIFVIDCFSTDATINICKEYKQVHVIQHLSINAPGSPSSALQTMNLRPSSDTAFNP